MTALEAGGEVGTGPGGSGTGDKGGNGCGGGSARSGRSLINLAFISLQYGLGMSTDIGFQHSRVRAWSTAVPYFADA